LLRPRARRRRVRRKRTRKLGRLILACFLLWGLIAAFYAAWAWTFDLQEVARIPESSLVIDRNGKVYTRLSGENRRTVPLDRVSPWFVRAVIAREDSRFLQHFGVDPLGIARAAYEYALEYAKERQAFGKPIIMNQAIAFKLANMITEIDASRLLIWRAAWLARNGGFTNAEGSMSKWKASEVAVRVTEEAIQILGGYGYTREYPVERWHRDAKIHTIFEGTSEIQQLVIGRAISGMRIE
jgi:hypothetical protein